MYLLLRRGLMEFVPLEADLQLTNPSCSCWSPLCQNNEMQTRFPFFWVRSWQQVMFSALRASGVTGSQRIRLSVSYGKSLVCCGCCFDFLVMCIFIHFCKNKHFNLLPHRSLAIPCQQCQANVISSPGMTHFLQLWSSEIITKAIAEMV